MICKSKNNRDGITLMFVLSMIVLFLLMGTTFVVVANDFAKASKRRALASSLGSIDAVDSSDITDSAFYLLVRGPSLDNVDSPLRTHSLLEDQYGYGFKGEVGAVTAPATTAVTLFPPTPPGVPMKRDIDELLFQIPMRVGSIESIRLGQPWFVPGDPTSLEEYYEREFIGRVISISSGNASGFSSRIIQHELVDANLNDTLDANDEIRFLVLPEQIDLVENVATGDEIIVNGRDFSGTGVGRGIDHNAEPGTSGPRPISGLPRDPLVDPVVPLPWFAGVENGSVWPREVLRASDKDNMHLPLLDDQGLFPNRIGQGRMDEEGLVDAYITHDGSTNEPYDLPDYQNMFLSGPVHDPTTGEIIGYIPSFHRDSLYINRVEKLADDKGIPTPVSPTNWDDDTSLLSGPPIFPAEYRSFSFRPVFVATAAGGVIPGSTANGDFYINQQGEEYNVTTAQGAPNENTFVPTYDTRGFGLLHRTARNSVDALDVDTDNDGIKDAVWIDIGLPVQTDAQGRSFRPLVAYKVIDMDSQLNLNVHGRATEAFANATGGGVSTIAAAPGRGLGVGVPEISLAGVFSSGGGLDTESYGEFLYERYRVGILDSTMAGDISDNLGFPGLPQYKRIGSVDGGIGGAIVPANRPVHPIFGYVEQTDYETRMNYLAWPANENVSPLASTIFGTGGDTAGLGIFTRFGGLDLDELFRMPEYVGVAAIGATDPRKVPSYASDFRVGGGAGDSFYSASDLESLLRPNDSDTVLSASNRFSPAVREHLQDSVTDITTHSFEIDFGITAMNVTDHLLGLLTSAPYNLSDSEANLRIDDLMFDLEGRNRILSNDLFRSGKMGINIVPEYEAVDPTKPYSLSGDPADFNPMLPVISEGRKYEFAKQFYCLALIVCGMEAPVDLDASGGIDVDDDVIYRTAIAQWAVNIVDFQDPDSVMTGFEFDLEPFDAEGWEADLDLTSTDYDPDGDGPDTPIAASTITGSTLTDIAIVWGAERPELLITETFAHHERRTENLLKDNGGNNNDMAAGDTDWDSRFVPQSSAFFEIYNPWSRVTQRTNLLAGVPTATGEFSRDDDDVVERDPEGAINISATVDAASMDPVWRVGFKVARADATFERTLYFTDVDTTTRGDDEVNATLQFGTSLVTPDPVGRGEHLVVGSAGNVGQVGGTGPYRTHFGRLQSEADPTTTPLSLDMMRGIGLMPGTDGADEERDLDGEVVLYQFNGSDVVSTTFDEVNVVVINQATQGGNPIELRSFSISDPVAGYESLLNGVATTQTEDGEFITDGDQVRDTPLDPMSEMAIYTNGLTNDFRFAYLQRLANPSIPHDAVTNPYRTIDSASFNLLAFNGIVPDQDNSNFDGDAALMEPGVTDGLTEFRSAERGESVHTPNNLATVLTDVNISNARRQLFQTDFGVAAIEPRVDPDDPDSDLVALRAGDDHNFSFNFIHTLGDFNQTYRDDNDSSTPAITTPAGWMAFNNRPFMTAGELFNVPCLPPENITENYMGAVGIPPAMTTMVATDGDFPYTMKIGGALGGGGTSNRFDLLRDYLEVPSLFTSRRYFSGQDLDEPAGQTSRFRFIDVDVTQEGMLNREDPLDTANADENSGGVVFNSFSKGNFASESVGGPERPPLALRPPYRRGISDFRSPGKVNANTVRSENVWDAVTGGLGMPFTTLLGDRNELLDPTSNEPTDFPKLFTTAENASFVPSERDESTAPPSQKEIVSAQNIATRNVEGSSLLRSGLAGTSGSVFSKNQLRQRLSSMTTTRSSVFSVWITVGYFEVDQFGRVGAEVGSEIGEVKRDRAFYMFDRSVPMASEPGKNHNVDRGVLVRTIIN